MKNCSKCGVLNPLDAFHRDSRTIDGRVHSCKKCRSEYKKQHYLKNKLKIDLQNKLWAKSNPEKLKCTRDKYKWENKSLIAEGAAIYRKNNYERITKQRRKDREKFKEYRRQNPGKISAISAKRRASEMRALPSWFHTEKEEIEELYSLSKEMRKRGEDVNVDHIVPLQHRKVCGLHTLANLQIISAHENQVKNNTFKV